MQPDPSPTFPPSASPVVQTVHQDGTMAVWTLSISARPEPLLLPRLLQKLAVPDIALVGMNFSAEPGTDTASVELRIYTTEERTRLTAAKLRKLVTVWGVGVYRG